MTEQLVLFDPRFIESYAGDQILRNPFTALVELIANSWDAGATEVRIKWSDDNEAAPFSLKDNGHGMSEEQFERRWRTLAYDRRQEEGEYVKFPDDVILPTRRAFGRNGVGRFAAFHFGSKYVVRTWRDGKLVEFTVTKGSDVPFLLEKTQEIDKQDHGTEIIVPNPVQRRFPISVVKSEIGRRFLVDPLFKVYFEDEEVSFNDLPAEHVNEVHIDVPCAGKIDIIVIDTKKADSTTKLHGVAWHVNGRLVGECSWKDSGQESIIDGRRIEAKRYTFIVKADGLTDSILADWTDFKSNDQAYLSAKDCVQQEIHKILLDFTHENRKLTYETIRKANQDALAPLTARSRERWCSFVQQVQEDCPSISEKDLVRLGAILATLENAKSKYGIIEKLSKYNSEQFDDLHQILTDWTVDTAKIVLDELQGRLKLIRILESKIANSKTDEVHELQPLFHQGLWIFGPEYETIEYTSNQGMTNVIQKLFKKQMKASLNRPDFAITTDSTVGLYSYPAYDNENGSEIGVDRLTIVELKKPGVRIGTEQKNQCWKYVKELYDKGLIHDGSSITCFALGANIDPTETGEDTKNNGKVSIRPLRYDTVLIRAKSRTLKLYDRVKSAPFLDKDKINDYLKPSHDNEFFDIDADDEEEIISTST